MATVIVATDPAARRAYPVPIDTYFSPMGESGYPTTTGTLTYGMDSDRICIEGAVLARNAIKDRKSCFVLQGERFIGYKTAYMEQVEGPAAPGTRMTSRTGHLSIWQALERVLAVRVQV